MLILAHELALRLGRRLSREAGRSEARGYIVSSALALLGLLVGFTFNAAQERFQARRDLVVAEANAIGTSYLRLQLLEPPWRDVLGREFLAYAETRLGFTQAGTPAEIDRNARRTGEAQAQIWRDLRPALRAESDPGLNLALVQSLNETFDVAAARRAAREARVPLPILRALLLCSLTVAAIVGYTEAAERRATGVLFGVLLLLTLAMSLILDLDRPAGGRIRERDAPLQQAVAEIRASQAAKQVRPASPPKP